MKTVLDLDGHEVEVSKDTICHAGINGSLPTLYSPEELVTIEVDLAERAAIVAAEAPTKAAQEEINRLERQITLRRIREALLGTGNVWMVAQEALIEIERNKLV